MLNLDGLNIEVTRGDTGSIRITFIGEDIPEDGTIALVTVKKAADTEEIWSKRIEVENGGCVIPLTQESTTLDYGQYRWDLRLIYEDGAVYTPMPPAKYTITTVIGDASDDTDAEAVTDGE